MQHSRTEKKVEPFLEISIMWIMKNSYIWHMHTRNTVMQNEKLMSLF